MAEIWTSVSKKQLGNKWTIDHNASSTRFAHKKQKDAPYSLRATSFQYVFNIWIIPCFSILINTKGKSQKKKKEIICNSFGMNFEFDLVCKKSKTHSIFDILKNKESDSMSAMEITMMFKCCT